MKEAQHTAFYLAHCASTDWLINQIVAGSLPGVSLPLQGLRGEVFSNATLQHFIDEEIRHDHFEIVAGKNNILSASSGGEQRKALLFHIIGKNPGYIVIDNVFESLDKDARKAILLTLHQLAATTILIQVFNRKNDLLPFIETIYFIETRSVTGYSNRQVFLSQPSFEKMHGFSQPIPPPLKSYEPQNGPLVKMNNVSVQYNGRPVLQNICWEIHENEFWQLTGPNGSGKSTLLSLITGNSPKGFGQDLVLFGHQKGSGETVWELKERIGYFTPAMAMHFERQDSIEQMIISGFFDSVGLYIKPSDRQVQVAREWLSLTGFYEDRKQPFRM
ncbi:MAG: ATP-binding cassette domain-containing protein, partial [Ferruginibacter sp.]